MKVAVVLFTRDLRVHDNPALAAAVRAAERVVPLFVHDPKLPAGDNRRRFLEECLTDLKASLRSRGADLVELHGDPVVETIRVAKAVGAEGVGIVCDVSGYARARQRRLERACAEERIALKVFPGVTVVPPNAVRPSGGGDHYKVFTPYWRAWQAQRWRPVEAAPERLSLPEHLPVSWLPSRPGSTQPVGETAARLKLTSWLTHLDGYADDHDAMAADRTSRLSPYLHFGCVSPRELAARAYGHGGDRAAARDDDPSGASHRGREGRAGREGEAAPGGRAEQERGSQGGDAAQDGRGAQGIGAGHGGPGGASRPGAEAFVRQLCWRDFYHQVLFAFPELRRKAYRAGAEEFWRVQADALQAWKAGLTGVPIVDAGMRQLRAEGWMHNRARLITASYLTKHLLVDWRDGADHFFDLLLDGDVANNYGNWQWVAGTGNDTKPYRRFNPIRQAERFDPLGAYVRRYVPELAAVEGKAVHQPWTLPDARRRQLDYPQPLALP